MKKEINDTQDMAIRKAANDSHNYLCTMYDKKKEIILKHKFESEDMNKNIRLQEDIVVLLCANRITTFRHKDTDQLIMSFGRLNNEK